MKSIRRLFPAVIAVITLALLLCSNALAYDQTYTNTDTGYGAVIDDQADLLSESEERSLLEIMSYITEYGNAAFVSVDENYYSASVYAEDYFYDEFGYCSGTVFLIDMDNRQLYIYSAGEIYETVSETDADTITDNVYTLASAGSYSDCAEEAFKEIYTLLEGGKIARPMKYICNALLALISALLIIFIIIRLSSGTGSKQNVLLEAGADVRFTEPVVDFVSQTKTFVPKSGGSGGGHSGGGHSGGGHSGGGHSGGGGGHKF